MTKSHYITRKQVYYKGMFTQFLNLHMPLQLQSGQRRFRIPLEAEVTVRLQAQRLDHIL